MSTFNQSNANIVLVPCPISMSVIISLHTVYIFVRPSNLLGQNSTFRILYRNVCADIILNYLWFTCYLQLG